MASTSGKRNDLFDDIVSALFKGIYLVFACFFEGIRELKKKTAFIVFSVASAVVVVIFILIRFFGIGDYDYVLYSAALPVAVLLILGGMRKQKQSGFEKIFTAANFRGKDGRVPLFLDSSDKDGKTQVFFKSNIPLSLWEKNKELLQTALDVQIVLIEQGKSNKIVRMEYVAADFDLPKKEPWKPEYLSDISSEIVLGVSRYGQLVINFNDIAHWLVGGAPGTGKSGLVRLIAYQCFLKDFKVYIMDFKRGMEFGKIYDHFCEVVMDKKRAAEVLKELYEKCLRNADIIREKEFKNIDEYNKEYPHDPMERYVIIIDELAALLLSSNNKEEKEYTATCTYCLEQMAILGRAPGFNLVLGIQRPDANTVTGQIKTNVSGRISGYLTDTAASMIVLQNARATELPPPSKVKGRYMFQDGLETFQFQGYYLDDFKAMKELLDKREKPQHPEESGEPTARPASSPPRKSAGTAAGKRVKPRENTDLITDYDDFDDAYELRHMKNNNPDREPARTGAGRHGAAADQAG